MTQQKDGLMKTECIEGQAEFHPLSRREVVGAFNGGRISSDGGGLLLREVESRTGILKRLGACFVDHRDPDRIEHTVGELVSQRTLGLALGYEDLNDHDQLRHDPLLGVLVEKADPTGAGRVRRRDRGKALAGKSTLNRLELTAADADAGSRYKKIVAQPEAMDRLMLELFVELHGQPQGRIWLDVDATDDPLHGHQEGRFFHGYYGHYCYLPLYIFCGDHLLCARLREANADAAAGVVAELERIVTALRQAWPEVQIGVRGDSGFCREELMAWCEAQSVDYVLGLAKNARLKRRLAPAMAQAEAAYQASGQAARVFAELRYRTLKSWSAERRVVGKAERLVGKENPRFVVTTLAADEYPAQALYEDLYCARGDMENRIKEQQLDLFADRTSSTLMRTNQLRLYFSSFAYLLLNALRQLGLKGTDLERAQCSTLRLKLLKIGAQVRISVRRVWVALSEACPYQELFWQVLRHLRARPAPA